SQPRVDDGSSAFALEVSDLHQIQEASTKSIMTSRSNARHIPLGSRARTSLGSGRFPTGLPVSVFDLGEQPEQLTAQLASIVIGEPGGASSFERLGDGICGRN